MLVGEMLYFTYALFQCPDTGGPNYLFSAFLMLVEASILLSPSLIIKGKWIWSLIVFQAIMSLIFFTNEIYASHFDDLISLSQIFTTGSYNSFVWESGLASLRPIHMLYFLPSAISAATLIFTKAGSSPSLAKKIFLRMLGCEFIGWIACFFIGAEITRRNDNAPFTPANEAQYLLSWGLRFNSVNQLYDWRNQSIILYTLKLCERHTKTFHIRLSKAQITQIDDYIRKLPAPVYYEEFRTNKDKNLIIIVVESLNSSAIGTTISGHSLTPVLDSLLSADNVISNLNIKNRIGKGKSSDGQMMINTGMLPLLNGPASMWYGDNKFHSLAEYPGYTVRKEYIPESPSLWNHHTTSRSWGFDILEHSLLKNRNNKSEDEIIMQYAMKDMAHLKSPFMLFITTSSMHSPFSDAAIPRKSIIDDSSLSALEKDYLHSLNNFDRLLGEFLDYLKRNRSYEDSIIVVVSDHGEMVTPEQISKSKIGDTALIMVNAGKTLHLENEADQADIYPTLLEILYRHDSWRGLGISMLNPDYDHSLKRGDAEIADMMIRGNYFKR